MIAIFPAIASTAAAHDFEQLAVLVRQYFAVGRPDVARINIEDLVARVGIRIAVAEMPDLAAIACRDSGGRFEVGFVLRLGEWPVAQRQFILAHLLGHFLIDVQPQLARGEWRNSGYRERRCPMERYGQDSTESHLALDERQREERADQFAAALLMPKGMVLRAMERLGDERKVAAFFGVTVPCLTRRLEHLSGRPRSPASESFAAAERLLGTSEISAAATGAASGEDLLVQLKQPRAVADSSKRVSVPQRVAEEYRQVSAQSQAPTKDELAKSAATSLDSGTRQAVEGPLSRIRALARRIDKSVE